MTTATIVTTLTTVTTVTIKTTVTTMMTATIVSRARIATAGTTVISTFFSFLNFAFFCFKFFLGFIVVPKQIVEQCLEAKKLLKGVFTDLACLYGYLLKKGFTEKFSTQKTCMENKMAAV